MLAQQTASLLTFLYQKVDMSTEFETDLEHNLSQNVPYRKHRGNCALAQMNDRVPEQERFLHPMKYMDDIAYKV
jgi:hypothetical protein